MTPLTSDFDHGRRPKPVPKQSHFLN